MLEKIPFVIIHIFNLAIQTKPKYEEDIATHVTIKNILSDSNRVLNHRRVTVDIVNDGNGMPVKVRYHDGI